MRRHFFDHLQWSLFQSSLHNKKILHYNALFGQLPCTALLHLFCDLLAIIFVRLPVDNPELWLTCYRDKISVYLQRHPRAGQDTQHVA